ncbi:MAG: type VI secretion system ImpA family N-terminal domain-containing protein [Planctomycetes bacterium]|nr:type VI secretion system ImpA family N-terminal domain-containing protein [Planctomycetota bacterium]
MSQSAAAAAVRCTYRHLGSSPVSSGSRAGDPARYEPAFVRLEAEIAKLDALQGDAISWPAVRDDAAAVLASSKDLLAASYLAVALHRIGGAAGLADGLGLMCDLVRTCWVELHPLGRPRARRSAMHWLSERVAQQLAAEPITDRAAFALCQRVADELWMLGSACFPGEDCGLGALRRAFSPATDAATTATDDSEPGHQQESPIMTFGTSVAATDRDQARSHLTAACDYFTRAEPHSPIGPLLQRALAWSAMSFEDVFAELLVRTPDAKANVWQLLGIKSDDDERR